MKKNYISPNLKMIYHAPCLMDSASALEGNVNDSGGNNQGTIGWGGESDPTDNPDAKRNNIWDW